MKALVVNAEWDPRKCYPISEDEEKKKRAVVGSQVWKNTTFEIKDIPIPQLHNSDDVLIRVKSCGICGSDTHLYETDKEGYILFSGLTKLPCVIGHEFAGIIEEVGSGVRELKKGDMVAVESIMWCGRCQSCRSGFPNQCKHVELIGLSTDGAFAEYIALSERYCWKINHLREVYPEESVFDIGALIEPVGCAYNGIFVVGGGFNPGAIVVVYGAGPIGLGAIALARIAGAGQIIAFDVMDERVQIAKELGADYSFNISKLEECSPRNKVMELTRGCGADIQIEAAGAAPKTIPEMERSMAINGKIIYLGRSSLSTPVNLDTFVSGANKIIGARGHSGHGIFPSIIKLIAAGKLRLEKMVTARYPFERVIEAIKTSSSRRDGKILVRR